MNIENNIKLWSNLGMRATFGLIAMELAKKYPDLMITTSDVSTSAGLDRYKNKYPDKFIDVGIAEQNLIGVSAGLSSEGFKVISTTFSPFQTLRCCEQIKVHLGYMKHKICMVGLASGLVLGNLGFTHCSIEDIGSLRSIPNISIVVPSDPFELFKALNAAIEHKNSVYIRLTAGANSKIINAKDYEFKIGKAVEILPGKDVAIIGCGNILGNCLEAASILREKKIQCSVVNMHTIKPLDTSVIDKAAESSKLIVSVEEHSIIGGLGGAIAEYKTELKNAPPQLIIGLPDKFGKVGKHSYLLEEYGLTARQIAERIMKQYKNLL